MKQCLNILISFTVMPIGEFIEWLKSSKHLKNAKTAAQHGHQVFNIWRRIRTSSTFSVDDMLDAHAIEDVWFEDTIKTFRPGTVKSQLGSLKLFIDFMLDKQLSQKSFSDHNRVGHKITLMRSRLKKMIQRRRTEVQVQALEGMIAPREFGEFLRSDFAQTVNKQLEANPAAHTQGTYRTVRDYIILRILMANGQRTGAVLGITPKVLRHAHVTDEGATLTVS